VLVQAIERESIIFSYVENKDGYLLLYLNVMLLCKQMEKEGELQEVVSQQLFLSQSIYRMPSRLINIMKAEQRPWVLCAGSSPRRKPAKRSYLLIWLVFTLPLEKDSK
jgi:hypothetical protein